MTSASKSFGWPAHLHHQPCNVPFISTPPPSSHSLLVSLLSSSPVLCISRSPPRRTIVAPCPPILPYRPPRQGRSQSLPSPLRSLRRPRRPLIYHYGAAHAAGSEISS